MNRFENRVISRIREENLLPPGSRVIVGFSGGADSVTLLNILWKYRRMLKIEVSAAHVNHGIRGAEADRDEAFCKAFCAERQIPLAAIHVDAPDYARANGMSVEEAGRELRYEKMRELADGARIATAHHANDQAETILLNLFRGSGVRGLSGIRSENGDIVRPLLAVSKADILSYIKAEGLSYVTDSTNLDNDYTRNRLRNVILPEITSSVNARAVEHVVKTGDILRQADEYFTAEARAWLSEHARRVQGEALVKPGQAGSSDSMAASLQEANAALALKRKVLLEKPQIFRSYVIMEALSELGVPLKDMGELHFRDIDRALAGHRGTHVDLPGAYVENTSTETIIYRRIQNHGIHD